MKRYIVTCTVIYNGGIGVEADSRSEAVDKVSRLLDSALNSENQLPENGKIGAVPFTFGEATADYADEV